MKAICAPHTAILIFANSSIEEQNQKGIANATTLYDSLTTHALRTVKKTNLPYFIYSEKEQIGSSFGERFANAIQSVFHKGYEAVITIGNDTPQLKASQLIKSVILLSKNNTVLGPSTDGGFYLMGLHKNNFEKSIFTNLQWQTQHIRQELTAHFYSKNIQTIALQYLTDIDNLEDIRQILKYIKKVPLQLRKLLLQFIQIRDLRVYSECPFYQSLTFGFNHSRGSPF